MDKDARLKLFANIFNGLINLENKLFAESVVAGLLFGVSSLDSIKNSDVVVSEYIERYKKSISSLNWSVTLNVGFSIIAIVAYLGIDSGQNVKIPFIDIEVSRDIWLILCPAISFILQIYVFVALMWLLLLRRCVEYLKGEKIGGVQLNILVNMLLSGITGAFWFFYRIYEEFRSPLNYTWTIPIMLSLILMFIGPLILSGYFTYILFTSDHTIVATIYSIILISSMFLLTLMLLINLQLSLTEPKREKAENILKAAEYVYGFISDFTASIQKLVIKNVEILNKKEIAISDIEELYYSPIDVFSGRLIAEALESQLNDWNSPLFTILYKLRGVDIEHVKNALKSTADNMNKILDSVHHINEAMYQVVGESSFNKGEGSELQRVVRDETINISESMRILQEEAAKSLFSS